MSLKNCKFVKIINYYKHGIILLGFMVLLPIVGYLTLDNPVLNKCLIILLAMMILVEMIIMSLDLRKLSRRFFDKNDVTIVEKNKEDQ